MTDQHVWDYPTLRVTGTHDLSGIVTILNDDGDETYVKGEDLKAFIADYVRDQRIGRLEAATDQQIIEQ